MTDVLYLFGIYGHPELSPAMKAVEAAGFNVHVPSVPGFDGKSGFTAPEQYLDWYTIWWDAIDALGAGPYHVVGASLGGMVAAELAILRPEIGRPFRSLHPSVSLMRPIRDTTSTPKSLRNVLRTCSPKMCLTRSSKIGADP